MNAQEYRQALRESADKAEASHPNNPELRSMLFLAILSAYVGFDDRALGDRIYNLTENTPFQSPAANDRN